MRTLVKPLRKLSLLSVPPLKRTQTNSESSGDTPPTKTVAPSSPSLEQQGRVLRLPDEIALCILSQLDFENLVQAQLTCRLWRSLAQDAYLWKRPCGAIASQHEDLNNFGDDDALSWPARYCRLQNKLNWKMGAVQRVKLVNVPTSRLLSVKLRDQLLLTLSEDNVVQLYKYDVEQGFVLNLTWKFCGQRQVECIDLLPEIHTVVVACRGSKCMFYDVASKNPLEPIQVLKGGAHSWFIPDDVALTCDYFALSGRKPSAVFVWNWRKGVRLSHKALNNQPHAVHISGDHLITLSVDGFGEIQHIYEDHTYPAFDIPACSIPSQSYNGELQLLVAPFTHRSVYQFTWRSQRPERHATANMISRSSSSSTSSPSSMTRRLSSISLFGLTRSSSSSKKESKHPHHHAISNEHNLTPDSEQETRAAGTQRVTMESHVTAPSTHTTRMARTRRHSSYNNYGYACQARTDQYLKSKRHQQHVCREHAEQPDFMQPMSLRKTIRTHPLGPTANGIINVASSPGRIATVNRHGDIAIYKDDGTTAAQLHYQGEQPWMDVLMMDGREDDDLSDGYDFMRTRLAVGPMGVLYGSKKGWLWWLDFGVRLPP